MRVSSIVVVSLVVLVACAAATVQASEECEVCHKVIKGIEAHVAKKGATSTAAIEKEIKAWCKAQKNPSDKNFCYNVGGLETSASSILRKISTPLSRHIPAERVCKKLKKADASLCSMKYPKPVDWSKVNIPKMKVRELKKVLSGWGEACQGCFEKRDYVKRVQELLPKHEDL